MRTELNDALELETSLHEALAAGALTVAYQPIIELESGQPAGVEALARWPRSRHTPVGPSVFVPLAEQTGLIHSLGDWLIRTTASHHSTWGRPELGLAVNVSIRQLERPEFPAIATTHFMGAGVSPDAVVFEVTETSYAHADDTVVAGLQSLRSRGFRVALDDFGAGNSSFDRIRRYPIDVVKIDRAYTELADADARSSRP
jgi:EAL domain-containing protein (putative c-di-GMP-specific phosphodiesterase class I)